MDIAEAESEIVAGYHTEYGGIKFGFFYQAEYLAASRIAAVIVALYLGGWTLFGLEEWIPGWLIFLGKLYARLLHLHLVPRHAARASASTS